MKSKGKYSRRNVVNTVVDLLESGVPVKEVAQSLAAYLIDSEQVRNVELYLRDIEIAISERMDVMAIHVSSATKLNRAVLNQIKELVADTSTDQKIEIIEDINPGLVGGVVVKTADSELDGSIRTKLQQLRSI